MSLGADSLLLAAGFGVFSLEGSNVVLVTLVDSLGLEIALDLGVGVKLVHEGSVFQGVLVAGSLLDGVDADGAELALNVVGVDDSGEIGAGHHVSIKLVARLLNTLLSVGTEDLVKALEGISGEDDESAEVTTRGELEEVESVHGAGVNTGQVAGGSLKVGVLVTVDNKGTSGHLEAGVSHLVEAGTGGLGGTDSLEIVTGTNLGEGSEEGLGGVNVEGVNNKGELGHVVNVMATGEDEGSNSRGSKSGGNGVSLLGLVDLSVPLSPGLEGGEHATLTAHVTESGLAGSGGT